MRSTRVKLLQCFERTFDPHIFTVRFESTGLVCQCENFTDLSNAVVGSSYDAVILIESRELGATREAATRVSASKPKLDPSAPGEVELVGIYSQRCNDLDEDVRYTLEVGFPAHVGVEFANFKMPVVIGGFARCIGSIVIALECDR